MLYRYVPILCALAALAAVSILVGRGTEKIQRIETLNEASVVEEPVPKVAQLVAQGGSIEEPETAAEKRQFPKKEEMEMRIGGFEPPKRVPSYEIVEDEPVDRDGAKAARLLVDTQVTSKEDFTLISRDIKSKYKDLDALSIEFTDTSGTFSHNGAAVIFNTVRGARFTGYTHHPPSNDGYYVSSAKG